MLLLAPAGGCLFVSSFNHPPSAYLGVSGGADETPEPDGALRVAGKCVVVVLDPAGSSDPDPGDAAQLTYEWRVDGMAAETNPMIRFGAMGGGRWSFAARESRDYRVELIASDPRNAHSPAASITLRVADAPPRARIQARYPAGGCGGYAAGSPVLVDGSGADSDAACAGETLAFHFALSPAAAAKKASLVAPDMNGRCDSAIPEPGSLTVDRSATVTPAAPGDGTASACLFPDAAGDYMVALTVDDGAPRTAEQVSADGQVAAPLAIRIAPDRPPCMDGFDPAPGKVYVYDRSGPATVSVTEVLDDLDPFPQPGGTSPVTQPFTWSLWRESDPAWRDLPAYFAPSLALDPARFSVDELVQVRVQAHDRVPRPPPACSAAALECDYAAAWPDAAACYSKSRCEAWATWQLRFR